MKKSTDSMASTITLVRMKAWGALAAGALFLTGAGFAGGYQVATQASQPAESPAELAADEGLEGLEGLEAAPETAEVLSDDVALEQARALGLLDAMRKTRPTLRTGLVERMGIAFVREAHRNGLDPLLVAAVAQVESHYNPFATSPVGARGVLQVRPMTGRWVLSRDKEDLIDDGELYDLETNVELGARYLASLIARGGPLEEALVAYNRGARGARIALSGPNRHEVLNGYPRKVLKARDGLERERIVATLQMPDEDSSKL